MTTEKQRKTFLSYSRVNKDFAIRLAKELKTEGFHIWLDLLDIPAGSRWDIEVENALADCEIFMIIMTPAAIASENVRDEIGYAVDNGKRFLPVLLENCNVPLRLRRFQYVDFTNKSFDDGVESAKELLRNLIAQTTIPRGVVVADLQAQAEAERKVKEEADRLATQIAEEERVAKAKEAERKAKEETDRIAAKRAEEERVAQAQAEAERKAKEEAGRLVAQKAEEERVAKAQVEAEREAKKEAERLVKQKAEEERVSKAQAEAERKAEEEADRLAAQKAEAERLAKQKAEDERVAKAQADREAKAEAERKAKEEADRFAAEKAEADRLAREKMEVEKVAQAEADRKAKEEADRVAKQKAEEERLAKIKVETERKAKEEADRLARQKAEEERVAKAKAETEQKAEEAVDHLAAQNAETEREAKPVTEKKPMPRSVMIGIFAAITLLVVCGVGGIFLSRTMSAPEDLSASNPPAGKTATAPAPAPTNTPRPTSTPKPTPTPIPVPILLESSEAEKIFPNGDWKGIFATAREQHTDDELDKFFEDSQPIPVTLTNPGAIVVGYTGIWCATTRDILEDNLKFITIILRLDNKVASESNYLDEYYTDENGHECFSRRIVIDQWITGEYTIYQEITLTVKVNDGTTDQDPFTESQSYVVTVSDSDTPVSDKRHIFVDDFSDTDSGWAIEDWGYYENGHYYLKTFDKNSYTYANPDIVFSSYGPDVVIGVDITYSPMMGIYCRLQENGAFYMFLVEDKNSYGIWYNNGADEWENLISGDMNLPDDPYNIQGACVGNTLKLFVNNEQVGTVTDTRLAGSGGFGLYTESLADQPGSTVGFDNFVAYAHFTDSTCSMNSDQTVEVQVENQSGTDLVYLWIDYDCNAQYLGMLPAGESMTLYTYVTHPILFIDPQTGDTLLEYAPKDGDSYLEVP